MSVRTFTSHVALGLVFVAASTFAVAAKVFVADQGSDSVTVVDVGSWKKLKTIPVGSNPHNVQVSPDGKRVWVTNNGRPGDAGKQHGDSSGDGHGSGKGKGEVWAIDVDSYAVAKTVSVGSHPAHMVLTPDGRYAYVTNGGDGTVSVVDVQSGRLAATVKVGESPHGIRISPDGREAYVANLKGGTVSIIDTASMKESARMPVGKGPAQTGFTPDGRLAFVSLSGENQVAFIDPASRKVIRKVAVGPGPIQLHATADGKRLLVANEGSEKQPGTTVSVIDVDSGQVAATVKTGRGAHGIAIGNDGRYAFVTNIYEGTMSVIDIGTMKVVATVPTGKAPNGITVSP